MALKPYSGSPRTPWPTAFSGAHLNDTYFTAEGCRRAAAALVTERLGVSEQLAEMVGLAYAPIFQKPRPRGDLFYELKARQRSCGPLLFVCRTHAELDHAARKALGIYFGLAVAYGDGWYSDLFSRALEGDVTPAEAPPFYRRIQPRYHLHRLGRGLRHLRYEIGARYEALVRRQLRRDDWSQPPTA